MPAGCCHGPDARLFKDKWDQPSFCAVRRIGTGDEFANGSQQEGYIERLFHERTDSPQTSVSELASVELGCKPRCLSFSRKVNLDNPNQRAAFA